MKIIETPVYNEDGSVRFTQEVSPQEAQTLLSFALNFLVSTGLAAQMGVGVPEDLADLEDFEPEGEPN
jgi:hypothetical protein